MNEKEFQEQIISHIDYRMDQMEKLVTLSLLNDVLPQYVDGLEKDLNDEIKQIIEAKNFYITKSEVFSDKIAIYLRTDQKVGIKEFRELKKLVDAYSENLIFVFEIDKATIIQKRKFLEENISYYIKGKELFISK